tara:strand:- start:5108 stop:5305 length:198 start_codon:yes stop_codon:yes gene_type:complete
MKGKMQIEFDFDELEQLQIVAGAKDLAYACSDFKSKLKWLGKDDADFDAIKDAWDECMSDVWHLF